MKGILDHVQKPYCLAQYYINNRIILLLLLEIPWFMFGIILMFKWFINKTDIYQRFE